MYKKVFIIFTLFGLVLSPHFHCSPAAECFGKVSALTVDPNGGLCQRDCECSNQEYDGFCDNGKCKSEEREDCPLKGKKRTCIPLFKTIPSCKLGVQICQPDYLSDDKWGNCEQPPKTERENATADGCGDGIDNDCDGKVDGADPDCSNFCLPGKTLSCYTGKEGTLNKGICRSGIRKCTPNGTWGECQGAIVDKGEDCNQKDDDCDGKIDNKKGAEANTLTRLCYTSTTGCTLAKGTFTCSSPCKAGIQTCTFGNWGPCKNEQTAQAETCNGIDDNCDGQVDNQLTDNPLCQRQGGPCKDLRTPSSLCQNGRWLPCDAKVYSAHFTANKIQAAFNGSEGSQLCDGVDNDCDGQIDEYIKNCVSTIAGGQLGNRDGIGTAARFNRPYALSLSSRGNLFVADAYNHLIKRIDPCGNVSTFAGGGIPGFKEGYRLEARFNTPVDLRFRPGSEELFVSDQNNHRVRRIDADGQVATVLGTGVPARRLVSTHDFRELNGFGLRSPTGLAFASYNLMYILHFQAFGSPDAVVEVDLQKQKFRYLGIVGYWNGFAQEYDHVGKRILHSVRYRAASTKREQSGVFYQKNNAFGTPPKERWQPEAIFVSEFAYQEGQSKNAIKSNYPTAMRISKADGWMYFTDIYNHKVRKVDIRGSLPKSKWIAGGAAGNQSGPLSKATFTEPLGLALDERGNKLFGIYISEHKGGHSIRRINLEDDQIDRSRCVVTSLGTRGEGDLDGPSEQASTYQPQRLAFGPKGRLHFSDRNQRIRRLEHNGKLTTIAGTQIGLQDGDALQARFYNPGGIAFDTKGNLYIADTLNHRIRKLSNDGKVTTFAGGGPSGSGNGSYQDGPRENARFNTPQDISIDGKGNIYVADTGNYCIRKIAPDGKVTTIGKAKERGDANGTGDKARFYGPQGLVADKSGNVYVVDSYGEKYNALRKISQDGRVSTLFGGKGGHVDGDFSKASLYVPKAIALAPDGALFIADWDNNLIRRVDLKTKRVSTFGGIYIGLNHHNYTGFQDGLATGRQLGYLNLSIKNDLDKARKLTAHFGGPTGIAVDARGQVFVADTDNHRIRKILQKP